MQVNVLQPHVGQVLHMRGAIPGYRFEWHPKSKKVFVVRINPSGQEIGDPIADDVQTHGLAINYVNLWCRGFNERDRIITMEKK